MKNIFQLAFLLVWVMGCSENVAPPKVEVEPEKEMSDLIEGIDFFLPKIDLTNWKVTLPIGSPTEVEPPAILDYGTNPVLKPYMYNDSTDAALVFYTYPGASTANSSFSRTELREQMVPGSNTTNWTFSQGGRMKGTMKMDTISMDSEGELHRTMVMQIHGRLTNDQRDLIGEDDNNAPPILKIYWQDGRIKVNTKKLKNVGVSDTEILKTSAWTDDPGFYFSETVGKEKFTLEVIASDGRLEVILNDEESTVYEGVHMEKWNVFENYFKAGNYLQTKDSEAFARVKYYDLEVSH